MKIIKIDECTQCMFCSEYPSSGVSICDKTDEIISATSKQTNKHLIPEWCPLEDAKEG